MLFINTDVIEASRTSFAVVSIMSTLASSLGIAGFVRAYFHIQNTRRTMIREYKVAEDELRKEHLSASSELVVKRKSSGETIILPQHYSAVAADELLALLNR